MKKLNQKGFSLVEGLLIIIALSLIGFVGFYVYNANKDNKSGEDSSIIKRDKDNKRESKDETAQWLEVTSGKKAFKLRVPDGWKLNNEPMQDYISSSPDAADITYKKGQKPTITNNEVPGSDAPIRFSVVVRDVVDEQEGTKTEFVLSNGQKGTKTTSETDGSFYGVDKITNVNYKFEKDGKFYLVNYMIFPDDPDNTKIVEKVVRTLQF